MQALIIFSADSDHPRAWMLHPEHRHVFCAIRQAHAWVVFDWHQGLPVVTLADRDCDLAAHYRGEGFTVIHWERAAEPYRCPILINNCVTAVKVLLGIRSRAVTPHALFRHVTGADTMWTKVLCLFDVPGFGGGSTPAPPPPPAPLPEPPKKADEAVQQARRDELARARLASGAAGTVKTTPQGLLSTAPTTQRSLLGN